MGTIAIWGIDMTLELIGYVVAVFIIGFLFGWLFARKYYSKDEVSEHG